MMDAASIRTACILILVVGLLGSVGPGATLGEFSDSHDGTASFEAADNFGGGGGPNANLQGPGTVTEGNTISLDGSGSTGKGQLTYTWSLNGNGTLSETGNQADYTAEAGFDSSFTVTVELSVQNNKGSDSTTHTITVQPQQSGNQDPTASFTASRQGNGQSKWYNLDGSTSTDPEGRALTYDWDIDGDGDYELTDASATPPKQKFQSPTTVTLQVTDDGGNTDTESKTVG